MDHKVTIAVFDVDETLIRCKSMFSFLDYALAAKMGAAEGRRAYSALQAAIQQARASLPREAVNRQFYKAFAGWNMEELRALAIAWFRDHKSPDFYIPEALARFRFHQQQGHRTLLLSGSATFILAPIAQDLRADDMLAIALRHQASGMTDGEIEGSQTIGMGKAEALMRYLGQFDSAPHLVGYGDHESDLPFLNLCDRGYVVLPAQAPWPTWAKGLEPLPLSEAAPQ